MARRPTIRGLVAAIAAAAVVMGSYRAGKDSVPTPVMVHITRSGERYHRPGCRYLRGGGVPTPLAEVKAGGRYRPCTVCRPPK